ncbi:MAG: NAD-dependent epimerase/dehydratase family protein [Vicinamibacteria bacterium]|nr:NAD-dependent epimerase/dehydratase family protein [Vicinamibacteria bacterium]
MRIAITGANGYLGRHLTAFLRLKGHEVVGVVRSSRAVAAVVASGGRPAIVDGLEPRGLARAFQGCDTVAHLAGVSAERGEETYATTNVNGTRGVIQAARTAEARRIVFISGLGVAHYGILRRATNDYFKAKLTVEEMLRDSDREAIVFRPSYIVGPGDELIPALLREMEIGEVEVVGDGEHRFQPVAVADAVEAILKAAERRSPLAAPIDLVGPEQLTYRRFIDRVARAAQNANRPSAFSARKVPVEEAEKRARSRGYRGLLADELDVLLCDEVSDPKPLADLLGRRLTPLDESLAVAVAGSTPRPSAFFRRRS